VNKKVPILFFILIYLNQGLSHLPNLSLTFMMKETWLLSATAITTIGFITGFAWYVKPIFGYLNDRFPIFGYHSKYYLVINSILFMMGCLYAVVFGLNVVSLVIIGTLLNLTIASSDVANDKQMIILEKKYNLSGKVQAVQWTAMGFGGLVVALLGAYIAKTLPEPINYRLAYALIMILPAITLYYLLNHYKEDKVKKNYKAPTMKGNWKFLKDKSFLFGLAFIASLNFCPGFGTALLFQMRDVLMIDKMFLGWLSATGTILGMIGYALYYWKAHKFPLRKLLYFSVVFSAMTNLFYLYIPNQWYIMVYSVLFGAFGGICFLAMMAYMAQIVPKGSEGIFYALVVSVNNLSAQGGSVMGGMIYDHYGYSVNVIISTIATLMCLMFIPKLKLEKNDKA